MFINATLSTTGDIMYIRADTIVTVVHVPSEKREEVGGAAAIQVKGQSLNECFLVEELATDIVNYIHKNS